MENRHDPELLSALADGELRDEAASQAIRMAVDDAGGRETWRAYHLIGEVMRTGAAAPMATAPDQFLARLQQRLDQEPLLTHLPAAPETAVVRAEPAPAANDGWWKVLAGVASIAALSAVAWNLWSAQPAAQPQLAAVPAMPTAPAVAQAEARSQPAMIRDPRLDQLLAAHRQLGGAGALQTPSGFLRNATYEGPAR